MNDEIREQIINRAQMYIDKGESRENAVLIALGIKSTKDEQGHAILDFWWR